METRVEWELDNNLLNFIPVGRCVMRDNIMITAAAAGDREGE